MDRPRGLEAMTSGKTIRARKTAGKLPILAAIYLMTVILPIGFKLGPLYLTSLRLVLIVAVIPMFVQLISGQRGKIYPTDILFFLHVIWMGLALAINSPSQAITQIGSVGVEFIGGYLLGRTCIRSRAEFIVLCKWLVVIVLCLLPFSLYEAKTGQPPILQTLHAIPGATTFQIVSNDKRLGLERVQSSFAHPIHYGLFCSVAFSLSFVALKDVYSTVRRLMSSFLIMIAGFLALSSGALLAMVLQIALISWSQIFARVKARWWLLVGLFVFAYIAIDLLSTRSPMKVFMSYATFSAHNAYWRSIIFDWGIKNVFGDAEFGIPAAPWFGIGMNDWVRPWYMYSGSMDNFWLVTAVRYGAPAFLCLAVGYITLIGKVMRSNFDDDPEMLRIRQAWVFTFLGLSFTLCTVHVWTNIYSFVFFMFGSGVWIIAEQNLHMASTVDERANSSLPSPETRTPYSRFPIRKRRAALSQL